MMVGVGLLIACASSAPQRALPANAHIDSDPTLDVGDIFDVAVYGEADLSAKYRVAEDGSINYPLVGRLVVKGKTGYEIADMVRSALIEHGILRSPNVSVNVGQRRTRQVSIMGAVSKPGTYPLSAGMSLVQAIGLAGGLSALARGGDAMLTRVVSGKRQRFKVDIDSITEGRASDLLLQAGDLVYVPERVF
jgi:polysaccharide export outer membrane protein